LRRIPCGGNGSAWGKEKERRIGYFGYLSLGGGGLFSLYFYLEDSKLRK